MLSECHQLAQNNVCVCVQAAQLCYEHLQNYQQGVDWAEAAVRCNGTRLQSARAHMALGIGLCLVAKESKLLVERQELNQRALNAFKM